MKALAERRLQPASCLWERERRPDSVLKNVNCFCNDQIWLLKPMRRAIAMQQLRASSNSKCSDVPQGGATNKGRTTAAVDPQSDGHPSRLAAGYETRNQRDPRGPQSRAQSARSVCTQGRRRGTALARACMISGSANVQHALKPLGRTYYRKLP
jgi:hypothetical protein